MSTSTLSKGVAIVFAGAVVLGLVGQDQLHAQEEAPFGAEIEVEFAQKLWGALKDANLVGRKSIRTRPFEGEEPHGKIVTTLEADVVVDGRTGASIVKRNYLGDDITVESVATFPRESLDSITVMFQREAGYDPENKNWFWVKYGPGGTVLENQRHTKLAGRIARGADVGCLACHVGAPGDDFVFLHDTFAE